MRARGAPCRSVGTGARWLPERERPPRCPALRRRLDPLPHDHVRACAGPRRKVFRTMLLSTTRQQRASPSSILGCPSSTPFSILRHTTSAARLHVLALLPAQHFGQHLLQATVRAVPYAFLGSKAALIPARRAGRARCEGLGSTAHQHTSRGRQVHVEQDCSTYSVHRLTAASRAPLHFSSYFLMLWIPSLCPPETGPSRSSRMWCCGT
mmetsp:Transcript_29548/g.78612  ORF Transcript_29548/g.78612 Transcript_29548/m.78612 type:complete len:209 (+) Transcript_29548:52-678(+)